VKSKKLNLDENRSKKMLIKKGTEGWQRQDQKTEDIMKCW